MKKVIFILTLLLLANSAAFAQKTEMSAIDIRAENRAEKGSVIDQIVQGVKDRDAAWENYHEQKRIIEERRAANKAKKVATPTPVAETEAQRKSRIERYERDAQRQRNREAMSGNRS